MEFNVKARTIFYENCCLRNNFVHRGFNLKERKKNKSPVLFTAFRKMVHFHEYANNFFNLNVIFVCFNNFSGMKVPLFFFIYNVKLEKREHSRNEWLLFFPKT